MAETTPDPSKTTSIRIPAELLTGPAGQSSLIGLVVAAVVSGTISLGGGSVSESDLEAVQQDCEEVREEVREVARELRSIREELIRANPHVRLTP